MLGDHTTVLDQLVYSTLHALMSSTTISQSEGISPTAIAACSIMDFVRAIIYLQKNGFILEVESVIYEEDGGDYYQIDVIGHTKVVS